MAEWYEELAKEIVMLAVRDYEELLKADTRFMKKYEKDMHKSKIDEIRRFFMSDWGNLLCYGRGKYILKELDKRHGVHF